MTSFNWFNRQYDQPASEEAPTEEANEAPAEAGGESAAPAIDQDSLSWAKAAYDRRSGRRTDRSGG
jgi:hypothetical protein